MPDLLSSKKLLIKPANTVLLINAPEGYAIADLPAGAKMVAEAPADVTLLFVKSKAEVESFINTGSMPVVAGGRFWMCYPKKTSALKTDISRDILHRIMGAAGWDGVSLVSLDGIWSAMRFRTPDEAR